MKIAVAGCAHGQIENIYNTIQYLETENNIKIDLLLCCGDFQATRNLDDLKCMVVPPKFWDICTFYKYYSGEKLAPVLTIFIGGNHEASNYLQELPFGGWVAPNIYYMGYAGVVNYGGIRIAGLSGIFSSSDYCKGRYEKPPYNGNTARSCYHIRNLDIFRLKQLSQPIQIMLSHDWPHGVYHHGNLTQLLKNKPYFKEDIENDSLGNKPTAELMEQLKPDYWFAAHLHVKFAALIHHKDDSTNKSTKFLALDKCLPRRKFLQVINVPHNEEEKLELKYDLEWLTMLYLTNSLVSIKKLNCYMPTADCTERSNFTPTPEEMESVSKKFHDNLKIPHNFTASVPPYDPKLPNQTEGRLTARINPQTVQFCEKLGVDDPIRLLLNEEGLNTSNTSLNSTTFDSSSFIVPSDTEMSPGMSPVIRGLKTPLKLPKPLNSYDIPGQSCWTSTPCKPVDKPDFQIPELKDEPVPRDDSSTVDESSDSAVGSKRFKRRNLAMYASNDDEI